ncbi:hypothetical protein EDC96DRAFT_549417 [Choanephora cucurbitarum]|nr:hypothetical protein EDC96DRAFT_549417 [Choanephora cucurbitarum]
MSDNKQFGEEENIWSLSNLARSLLNTQKQQAFKQEQPLGMQHQLENLDVNVKTELEARFSEQDRQWRIRYEALQAVLVEKEQSLMSLQQEFQQFIEQQREVRLRQGSEFDAELKNREEQIKQKYNLKLRLISHEKDQLATTKSRLEARQTYQRPVSAQQSRHLTADEESGSEYSTPSTQRSNSTHRYHAVHTQNTQMFESGMITGSQNRKRIHPVPIFKGTEKEDSYEWLLTFEKLVQRELWWDGKKEELRSGSFKDARKAFCDFFGGGLQAQSRALANIDSMKQGSESMVSFGPKLLIEITRITKETHIQLYFFYRIINNALADRIALAEPESLQEAVAYGVRLGKKCKRASLTTYNQWTEWFMVPLMPRTKRRPSGSKATAIHCGKKGHKAVDCYSKRHEANKGRPAKQNTQAISNQVEEGEDEEESNLFERLYFSSTQTVVYASNIATHSMKVIYSEDPRRFAVTAKIKNQDVGVLADTGAMISTINRRVADDLGLELEDEADSCIEYGNKSREVVNKSTKVSMKIDGQDYECKFLVVNKQNVPVILGMDFFIAADITVYPAKKLFIPGATLRGLQEAEKATVVAVQLDV